MSYNVTSTITLRSTLALSRNAVETLLKECKGLLPEIHFLSGVRRETLRCPNDHQASGKFCSECGAKVEAGDELIQISDVQWAGMGSGYMGNFAIVAQHFKGEADVVLIWEGGDSETGIQIRDGVVTEHDVSYTLGPSKHILHPEKNGDGRL